MRTKISDDYISNRAWLRDIVGGKPLILRGVSALEYLELIDGYFGEEDMRGSNLKSFKGYIWNFEE